MGRAPGLEDQTPREQAGEGGVGSNDPKLFSAAQVRRDERLSEDDFEIYEKVIISLSHTTPPPAARLFPSPFLFPTSLFTCNSAKELRASCIQNATELFTICSPSSGHSITYGSMCGMALVFGALGFEIYSKMK